ncbi:hypothetical protein E2C01_088533 [Portunus trituberculatus]|uniref:Uncharacterized protein n=1 Tax=Portunus trituberculatus TaxID=210409 RepID=A0A5B7JK53_PORTR|nr:hypothetical protein [Portunus trituberculatus]
MASECARSSRLTCPYSRLYRYLQCEDQGSHQDCLGVWDVLTAGGSHQPNPHTAHLFRGGGGIQLILCHTSSPSPIPSSTHIHFYQQSTLKKHYLYSPSLSHISNPSPSLSHTLSQTPNLLKTY